MNKNKIWILPILLICAVLTMSLVSQDVKATTLEGNSTAVCGNAATSRLRVNTTESDFLTFEAGALNITAYAWGNGAWYTVGFKTNNSGNAFDWNLTWDTTAVPPGIYMINFTFSNNSEDIDELSLRSNFTMFNVEVDNEGPTITFTSSNTADEAKVKSSEFTIDLTGNESFDSATININAMSYPLTTSTTTAKKTFGIGDLPDGYYEYYVGGDDSTSCTNTGSAYYRNVIIQNSKGSRSTATPGAPTPAAGAKVFGVLPPATGSNLVVYILVGLGLYYIWATQKKKR